MSVLSKSVITKFVLGAMVSSQLVACGTLIYPERNGQTGGRLDLGVVALNTIGLVLWFVPGVVAFGVDFISGAIYLPSGHVAQLSEEDMTNMTLPDGSLDQQALNSWLADQGYFDPASVAGQTFVTQAYQTPDSLKHAVALSSSQRYAALVSPSN